MYQSQLKKDFESLKLEFEQYKYDQNNLPKYSIGDKLKDGTVIVLVNKIELPGLVYMDSNYKDIKKYTWHYKGVLKGKIININQ